MEISTLFLEKESIGNNSDIMLDLPDNLIERQYHEEAQANTLASSSTQSESSRELRSAAIAVWGMCLDSIKSQVSAQSFRTWFEPLSAVELEGSQLTLKAPSNFFYEWITEHYHKVLEGALKEVLGPAAVFRFDVANEIDSLNTTLSPAPNVSVTPSPSAAPQQFAPQGVQPGLQSGVQQQNFPQQGYSNTPFAPQQAIGQPYPQNNGLRQNGNGVGSNGVYGSIPQNHLQPSIGMQQNNFTTQQPIRPQQNGIGSSQGYGQSHSVQIGQPGSSRRPAIENNLNPRYMFDTFIRGESNKLAYAAANAVANNPGGTSYNPLVLYGNVGLGKTHLIQAVGNYVLQKFSGARVLYTSSDRFTVEFVDAIQNDRIAEFNNLYRSIDVLIIDDVQFFAGKEKTQDIFFHTFNALRELGKQIILTCDRPPKELKDIDDRLLNRLQWGLTADLGAPDLETRIAILRHKAITDGIELHNDVIEFIATNVSTNIRELEGCLISLLATASLEGKEPNLELAREVLRKVAKRSSPVLSIETIQRTVAKRFNIDEELLRAKTRKQEVVQARQVAMYLAKELTNSSLKTIGLHFGGRDHSTVIHACQTISDDMRHSPSLQSKVEELRRQFELMQ